MNVSDFIKNHDLTPSLDKNHRLKIGNVTSVTIDKQALKALTSFWPHGLEVPISRLNRYPGRDTPLIVQIWSGKSLGGLFSDIHGQCHYKNVSVCSDGIGTNNRIGIRPNNRFFTTKIFLLSPHLIGLNQTILYQEMKKESSAINDYDLSRNNCIDHIIRPLQKAGAEFDFGIISTPKRLSEFCEQMVKQNKGVLISPKAYNSYLKKHSPLYQKTRKR